MFVLVTIHSLSEHGRRVNGVGNQAGRILILDYLLRLESLGSLAMVVRGVGSFGGRKGVVAQFLNSPSRRLKKMVLGIIFHVAWLGR